MWSEAGAGQGEVHDILSGVRASLLVDVTTGWSPCCVVSSINLSRCSSSGIWPFHLLKPEAVGSGKSARAFVLPCGSDPGPPEHLVSSPREELVPREGLRAEGTGWLLLPFPPL